MDNVVMLEERDERNTWTFERIVRLAVIILLIGLLVYLLKDYLMPKEEVSLGIDSPSVIELPQIEIKGLKGGFI